MIAGVAPAQVAPVGTEFQLNTYTSRSQTAPSVAAARTGAFVAVWESLGSDGSDDDGFSVRGRRFSAGGTPVGSEFQVNSYTTDFQTSPSVAMGPTGEFVVVWSSLGSSGTDDHDSSIQGRRFAADGTPVGTEFQVNTYTLRNQLAPSVAIGPVGAFVVAWHGEGSTGADDSGYSIQGQRFGADGTPAGSEFQVNAYTTDDQRFASLAVGPAGELVVVWASYGSGGNDDSSASIQGRRFGADGTSVGSEFQVNSYTTGLQELPSVAMGPVGEFVVVWSSSGSSGTDGRRESIQGRRFGVAGAPAGTEFQVNTYTTRVQRAASVAMDAAGDFAVAWQSFGSAGTDDNGYSIQARAFRAHGTAVGDDFQVNTLTLDRQSAASVAAGAPGELVVVWQTYASSGTDSSYSAVRGQRLRSPPSPARCGDPLDGPTITTADALAVLQTTTGAFTCPLCVCDVDGSGAIDVTDALIVLQSAVGIDVAFDCPPCV